MNATYREPVTSRLLEDHGACRKEIQRLTSENGRLRQELATARMRQEDLANSAEIWIRLYEAHLARARNRGMSCTTLPELPRS